MPDTAGASSQTRGFDFDSNPALRSLPDHLKQFAVDQVYDRYTPVDHAVWRYIMRQNVYFLKEHAHQVYFDGLLNTGISFERIPRIEEMNEILARIGWGAVAVDGFIPPAAFMEFQAYKVLVIAVDMRQVGHIEYTPAPDIVHEAAGHAPIIVDEEYARYLQRFGEIGARAMSSRQDFELYEAIRHLSILKESPGTPQAEIDAAFADVVARQENLGEPSEMALLSRLHWWTVEYGLIGSLEAPKIYGAGLLSSIGEAASCLEAPVKKLPYSLDAQGYAFDITTQQPQLFVTPDFAHLMDVLEQFAATMAFRVGGLEGLEKARHCARTATVVLSSGLQISGTVSEVLTDHDEPAFVRLTGPVQLSVNDAQLPGHGPDVHAEGFSTPVGRLAATDTPPEHLDDTALAALGLVPGRSAVLAYASGVRVAGTFEAARREGGRLALLTWRDATVTRGDEVLAASGVLDVAVGARVTSVFQGAADKTAYEDISLVPRERTIKAEHGERDRQLHGLYQRVRELRAQRGDLADLADIWRAVRADHPDDWLLAMEMFELLDGQPDAALREEIRGYLLEQREARADRRTVIDWGFRLVEFHRPSG
ncbi:MAG: aromatic amino acid hydroxylase [Candidatus Krumholzibacteriia bacterium]